MEENRRPIVAELLVECRARREDVGEDPPKDELLVIAEAVRDRLVDLHADEGYRAAVRMALKDQWTKIRGSAGLVDTVFDARFETESDQEPAPDVERLEEEGRTILDAPDQLELLRASLRALGFAGDPAAAELVHLALLSRALARPINVAVMGPSAAGKTFTVQSVARHHPEDVLHDLTASSERALAYSKFPTAHRFVLISESSALHENGVGATIVRGLAWGEGIRYETVMKTENGLEAVVIEKPGPTGLITTSTRPLDEEIATRLIMVHLTDAPAQIRAVVEQLARRAAGLQDDQQDFSAWKAASAWLAAAGETRIVVPWAGTIAEAVPVEYVRMNRDFEQVLTVIEAHAFAHQRQRACDEAGRLVADHRDYEAAHRLLSKVLAITLDDVSDAMRETVEVVIRLSESAHPKGVSLPVLADELGLSRSGASRRAKAAREAGYLTNVEEKKGYPLRLLPGEPLPKARAVLPDPETVFGDPSDEPPGEESQGLNISADEAARPGSGGVESTVEQEGPVRQGDLSFKGAVNTAASRNDGENPRSVEPLSAQDLEHDEEWEVL